jgi:hypothetical protein
VGVTERIELTIDELVLDGFERPDDAVEPIRDELRRQLGAQAAGQLRASLEPIAAQVVRAVERSTP